jgi:protein SCO1
MTSDVLRIVRYASIGLIAVLAVVWFVISLSGPAKETDKGLPNYGTVVIKPFTLVDQNGAAVSEKDVLGKPAVVFFGFTFCPDICPTTLASLTSLMGQLGPDADKVGVYFVSVDPKRDTPQALKAYLSSFDPRIRALTGTREQITPVANMLGAYFAEVPTGDTYSVDHSASIYLVDATGTFRGTIEHSENGDVALSKLKRLASGN